MLKLAMAVTAVAFEADKSARVVELLDALRRSGLVLVAVNEEMSRGIAARSDRGPLDEHQAVAFAEPLLASGHYRAAPQLGPIAVDMSGSEVVS